jgi:hypothetical protein
VAGIAGPSEREGHSSNWDNTDTTPRPTNTKRNTRGFAEGDRWRYQIYDRETDRVVGTYFRRIDRIEQDDSLWINDGAQHLGALGQPYSGKDEASGT